MFHRGFALVAVLAVAPAHATLIEYSFTAELTGARSVPFSVLGEFGLPVYGPSYVTGGLLFDDAAPRISYTEYMGSGSTSTYDMSDLRFWVAVGDHVLTATGSQLTISDAPPQPSPYATDRWILSMLGDGDEVNGYTVASMRIDLLQYGSRPLTSSELQVANTVDWGSCCYPLVPYPFTISFTDGSGFTARGLSISVPEPGMLSLLAAGVLGALVARRRRHVGSNA